MAEASVERTTSRVQHHAGIGALPEKEPQLLAHGSPEASGGGVGGSVTLGVGRETKGQLAHNNSGIVPRLASAMAVVSQTRSASLFLHCVKLPRRRNAGLLFRCVRPRDARRR